jgi:hypothetical protein
MMSEGLGRLYNVHYPADDSYVSLKDAAGVTFFAYENGATSASTVTFAADAAGTGAVTPDVIDHFYGRSADVSDGVWHRTAVSPASETTGNKDATTEDLIAIEILAAMCPDGKPYVKCAIAGSGIVFAVLHELAVQRAPQNLRSVTA